MKIQLGEYISPMQPFEDLPNGYKQSDLGPIPQEWELTRIGDLGKVVRGGSPRPAGDPRYFNGDFIPWLTVAALTNIPDTQLHVSETVGHLTEAGARHSRTLLPNTLIIANSGATLGVAKILDVRCCANDGIAAVINQHSGDKEFVCHYINSQTENLREVVATGNGQPNLNTTLIREMRIPIPPLPEQRAIAEALSDIDSLIAALNALIAKKRAIKLATMQQLLTGRTRLPGFEEEWETKGFGDLFVFLSTANNPRADLTANASVGYIHYGDIHTATRTMLDCNAVSLPMIAASKVTNVSRIRDGDLIMVDASEDEEGIGKSIEICGVGDRQIVAGLHTFLLRGDRSQIADGFKQYLQFFPAYRAAMTRLATGISVFGVSKGNVAGVSVVLPSVPEQQAIAAVLSDMDAEIEALEARVAKTRDIKQGMMQQLLTGRIRLVTPTPEEVPA